MKTKLFLILCILLITLTSLSGCYDSRGIEDLAYATAMGLDVSDKKALTLTLQFSIPSSSSESGSSQSSKTDSISIDCSSISSGIGLFNSYISKEVNLSHCKVIVISEELAEKGISEYLDTLANNIEIRPDCNVIISRCTAKDFIKNASPSIETLTARYYEVALNSSEYTGYTTSTKLTDFLSAVKSTFMQGHAILGGVNSSQSSGENGSEDSSSSKSSSSSEGEGSGNESGGGSQGEGSGNESSGGSQGEDSNNESSGGSQGEGSNNESSGSSSSDDEVDIGADSQSKANETPIQDSKRCRNIWNCCFL